MTTLTQARDAVLGVVSTGWNASGAASATVPLYFDNVHFDKPGELASGTSNAGPYAVATMRIVDAGQSTQGKRRYLTKGIVTVQIFTPKGDGNTLGDTLAQIVLDALRVHSGGVSGVWFFEVSPTEIGISRASAAHFQVNVNGSFHYQEVIA